MSYIRTYDLPFLRCPKCSDTFLLNTKKAKIKYEQIRESLIKYEAIENLILKDYKN